MAVCGGPREAVIEISRLLKEAGWPSREQAERLWQVLTDHILEAQLQSGREDD